MSDNSINIILASRSPYRRQLLERLALPFETIAADIDESRLPNETADDYVSRLAYEKANKIAQSHQGDLVIGSDQCVVVEDGIIGKPGDRQTAIQQLEMISGKEIQFLTGICILHLQSNWQRAEIAPFKVCFRKLSRLEIERYVDQDQPFDCAGSFKSEGLGITLCQSMQGNDPTALIGLPLIRIAQLLREFGLELP